MTDAPPPQPPGWYYAQGDPPGTQRYWDGTQWQGGPQPAPGPTPGRGGRTGTQVAGDLATPGVRIGARLIDLIAWTVVSSLLGLLIVGGSTDAVGLAADGRAWLATVLSTLAIMAYEVWFVANRGATPGKLALGLRVASADRQKPVDYRTALVRASPIALAVVPLLGGFLRFLIALASLIMLFTDGERQAVWDKLAKTVVVRA